MNLKKCEFVANRLIDTYLYGEAHPYGRFTSAAAFDAVNREQLVQYFNEYYVNGKCIIFVSGKLSPNLVPALNKYFGRLPFSTARNKEKEHQLMPAAEKNFRITNDPNGVQGAVRMATLFPNRHHPDFMKAQVLNNIFGGFFGSRLMSNIREDKGYTYGIHSYLQNHIHQSAWVISTEAGREVCEATVKEIHNEMQELRRNQVR